MSARASKNHAETAFQKTDHDWTEALPGTARRDYRLKGMNDKMHPVAEAVQKFLLTLDDAAQERDIFVTAEHPPSWFFFRRFERCETGSS